MTTTISRPENRYPRSSSFYSYSNCDAAFQLSQKSGEEPPNIYSDRGSAIHAWLYAGNKPDLEPGALETAQDLEAQESQLTRLWAGGLVVKARREERLWIRDGLIPVYSGKPDLWLYTEEETHALLLDYKTGWHPLDHYVATNCQLRSYVPLIDEELEEHLEHITVAILKPGKRFPAAEFDREAIDDARAWSLEVVQRTKTPNPSPNPGAWCTYCAGKVICPAWKTEIDRIAALVDARVSDIPDSALNELAPRLEIAQTVIEKLLARLYARVREKPEHFPDWRFIDGDKRRSVADSDIPKLYKRLVTENHDLEPEEFVAACRVSLNQLETRVRKNKKMTIREFHVYLDKEVGHLITTKRNKDKLVYDPERKIVRYEENEPAQLRETEKRPLEAGGEGFEGSPEAQSEGSLEPGQIEAGQE